MPINDEDYRIAAGYNVALVNLVVISSITPPGDIPFPPPKGLPTYDDGKVDAVLNGELQERGYAIASWFFTRMSYAQLSYLRTTYCNGGLWGLVTIYTQLEGAATFTRVNTIMHIKKAIEITSEYRYQNVVIEFTRLGLAA